MDRWRFLHYCIICSQTQLPPPWELCNRWINYQNYLNDMHTVITHSYREGNQLADKVANESAHLSQKKMVESSPPLRHLHSEQRHEWGLITGSSNYTLQQRVCSVTRVFQAFQNFNLHLRRLHLLLKLPDFVVEPSCRLS